MSFSGPTPLFITHNGETRRASEWAKRYGLTKHCEVMRFISRWHAGRSFEECLFEGRLPRRDIAKEARQS
jgi:hypothetical protein